MYLWVSLLTFWNRTCPSVHKRHGLIWGIRKNEVTQGRITEDDLIRRDTDSQKRFCPVFNLYECGCLLGISHWLSSIPDSWVQLPGRTRCWDFPLKIQPRDYWMGYPNRGRYVVINGKFTWYTNEKENEWNEVMRV